MKITRAAIKGRDLRTQVGCWAAADVELIAEDLGLEVERWGLEHFDEFIVGRVVAVAIRLDRREFRWALAHAIGHHQLHVGNQLWARRRTRLTTPHEREAEDFAYGLLVSREEVWSERLQTAPEIAEYFGIPEDKVRVQGRLI